MNLWTLADVVQHVQPERLVTRVVHINLMLSYFHPDGWQPLKVHRGGGGTSLLTSYCALRMSYSKDKSIHRSGLPGL